MAIFVAVTGSVWLLWGLYVAVMGSICSCYDIYVLLFFEKIVLRGSLRDRLHEGVTRFIMICE